jgi:hypothetical protein
MRTGQVIGATNRLGEVPSQRPVEFGEIVATIYRNLGIDAATEFLVDPTGRPQHIAEHAPMRELA